MEKKINAEDARDALGDAIADMAHVLYAEGVDGAHRPADDVIEFALGVEIANKWPTGMRHFRREREDEDTTVVVFDGEGQPITPEAA